ncbi:MULTISPECIES: hypothetical protein [unclassified Paenibacillus]|uniref:hypothetical protein n=1 Tax=unclassified Paenibacillus TaxID=185978 RepID=UPI0021094A91|nr:MULTISPECIES: hypothetical protein [unclassified Paenibacillus]
MVDIGGWLDHYTVNVFLKHLPSVLFFPGQEQVLLVIYDGGNQLLVQHVRLLDRFGAAQLKLQRFLALFGFLDIVDDTLHATAQRGHPILDFPLKLRNFLLDRLDVASILLALLGIELLHSDRDPRRAILREARTISPKQGLQDHPCGR